ncbi:MAG: hypothetical protein HC836_24780 [Richelia sp. RM2_1_2]|nr:hypothetical protein [Richelia sp. RM2_1_2]
MSGFYVQIEAPWRFQNSDTRFNLTYSPSKCVAPPYGYVFKNGGNDLYLTHADGDLFLETNWADYVLLDFDVIELSPCEIQEDDSNKYDCINGACIKSDVYNTPGIYNDIEECEIACGAGCSGKCLSNADWQKIQDLAKKIKNKNCS